MARHHLGLLIALLLMPAAAAVTTTDAEGDIDYGGQEAIHEPAIDLLEVTAQREPAGLRLRMSLVGPMNTQAFAETNDSVEYVYLFIIAVGADEDADVLRHVTSGGMTLAVRCAYHQGRSDFACALSAGEGKLKGIGIDETTISALVEVAWNGTFALGAGLTKNVGLENATVVAQDFSSNALPDAMRGPGEGDVLLDPAAAPRRLWFESPWLLGLGLLAVFGAMGYFVQRKL
jgi:hypothetical protein